MRALSLIQKKRDGETLSSTEIEAFAQAATDGPNAWPDYQLAAMLMAIYLRGLTRDETAQLTHAMAHSGDVLDWTGVEGPKVDKHSSGGVGDKTSMVVVPLAAACGVIVPKMSGRGLGHTGGTVDKLESIPGFRTSLSNEEFKDALRTVGAAMIGQTANIAPADKKLYALRDVTATVDHIPLITASILSKKLAENLDGLVLDVKCGSGAFMRTVDDARQLAEELRAVAELNHLPTSVLITRMDSPLGRTIGHSLEVIECIETLKGQGPSDLTKLASALAGRMVRLAGLAEDDNAAASKVRTALTSGAGVDKFRQIIERQGGDPSVIDDPTKFPTAPERDVIPARKSGFIIYMDAEQLGRAAMRLGAGRDRKEDKIDHAVGIRLHAKPGDEVGEGDALMELHWRDANRLEEVKAMCRAAIEIEEEPPTQESLILDVMG